MTNGSQPSDAPIPSDAVASITGTVVGDAPSADVVRPPAIHPSQDDPTDARSSLTGVDVDAAADVGDDPVSDDAVSEVDIVSE